MTLEEIRAFVVSVDPAAEHYVSASDRLEYTVWAERERLPHSADDSHEGGWAFDITRVTQTEFDPVAARLDQALDDCPWIAYRYTVQASVGNDGLVIVHRFACEGV